MDKNKRQYNIGDHITSEDGKLKIKNDIDRLIKYAEKEIKEWQKFLDNLKDSKERR